MGGRKGGERITERVDFGEATLVADPDRSTGWTLLLDGVPQSYVDLADRTWLEFEYVRRIGSALDLAAPPGEPLRVLHLGGGALTLPRYLAATRPGSVQRVVERDLALTALVRRMLPLARGVNLRIRRADARAVVEAGRPGRFDVVINDVYGGSRMPGHLTTREFVSQVARALSPGGWYVVNLADRRPLRFVRGQVATLRAVLADVCLVADPGVLRGRRFGNLVVIGVSAGGRLPVDALTAAAIRDAFPGRLLHGRALHRFVAGAPVVTDAAAQDSPEPPPALFARG